jgi:hypothetical protein
MPREAADRDIRALSHGRALACRTAWTRPDGGHGDYVDERGCSEEVYAAARTERRSNISVTLRSRDSNSES